MWLGSWHASATTGVCRNGQHLLDVMQKQPVEKDLIGVLQLPEVNVAF